MSQIRYFNSEMGKKSFLFPFKILVIWNRNYENLAQTWAFQKPKWQKKIWAQWIKYVFLKLFLLKNPGRRDIWQKKPFLGSGPDPKIWPQSNNMVKSYFTLEQSQTDRQTDGHTFWIPWTPGENFYAWWGKTQNPEKFPAFYFVKDQNNKQKQ